MPVAAAVSDRAQVAWQTRLDLAFRAAVACTIVGCTTLYGPPTARDHLAFPAFSYVTAVILVSKATLGKALRGCWHTIFATFLVLPPSVLILWAIGPATFTTSGAALAVAIGAFLVASLPEPVSLMTKWIALGQLVIVYVGAVVQGGQTGSLMHPVHVGASTALGALASIVALSLPFPRIACNEVRT